MAHNRHYQHNVEVQALRNLTSPPLSANLPSISEDECPDAADEPPDNTKPVFTKMPCTRSRAASLISQGLHTESESHDDELTRLHALNRDASRSSICSTTSIVSAATWTYFSETGFTSSGTRASTPPSTPPQSPALHIKPTQPPAPIRKPSEPAASSPTVKQTSPNTTNSPPSEPSVEAKLGRKRCITFACGKAKPPAEPSAAPEPAPQQPAAAPEKKPCRLKFVCPLSKSSSNELNKEKAPKFSRHLSPAPGVTTAPPRGKSPAPQLLDRQLRDSDSTIKISPRATRKSGGEHTRHLSTDTITEDGEAVRFHEFATSEDEVEDWVQELTCHKSRLTVTDTLKKENVIRDCCSEAQAEALEEEEKEEEEEEEELEAAQSASDDGFHSDDEDGFAASDDESDAGSDYEWWTHGGQAAKTPFSPNVNRFPPVRRMSTASMESSSPTQSFSRSPMMMRMTSKKSIKVSGPIVIRPGTPELPDSTDFVCGTLDEDRPLEQAYLSCLAQRKAAKRVILPQDIDPTFPTSDPEAESDEDSDYRVAESVQESDHHGFLHGHLENIDGAARGRQAHDKHATPLQSPKRPRSPAPISKRTAYTHALAPRALFGHSPVRGRSPMPTQRPESPYPSPGDSPANSSGSATLKQAHNFLGQRPQLTHTASLPRSPCPFARRAYTMQASQNEDDDDDDTAKETAYNRGAIDIVQGLEWKRLRRRHKFYERYCRKEEKKQQRREKRPQPGRGAQRMRQIGIECAEYKRKRVLSL